MNSLHFTVFFLLQAVNRFSSSPVLKNITISVEPNVYSPSVSFKISCTVEVSPAKGPFTVRFKHNDTSIGWWTAADTLGPFKWATNGKARYIISGRASYPKFTAIILGYVPETSGNYKCSVGYTAGDGTLWETTSISTLTGWNTSGSLILKPPSSLFSLLFITLLKRLL